MSLRDLQRSLRAGSKKVREGHFSLDRERALEKLREYRLAVAHHYVLDLVRAAVVMGSDGIQIRNDANDFEMVIRGMTIPKHVLRDLPSHALSAPAEGVDVAWRLFGLGFAGALATRPAWLRIASGGCVLRSESPHYELAVREDTRASRTTTRFHVRDRVGFAVLVNRLAGAPEEAALRKFCQRCPVPIRINGGPMEAAAASSLFEREVELDAHAQARFVVPEEPLEISRVHFDVHGVEVVERSISLGPLGFRVWVRDDRLKRNVSGSDIVANDGAYLRLHSRLRAAAGRLLPEVVASLASGEPGAEALRHALSQAARRVLRDEEDSATRKAWQTLREAPLLPGPAGEWYSIRDFEEEVAAGRPIRFAETRYEAGSYRSPVVWLDPERRGLVDALLPTQGKELRNVADEVRSRGLRERARAAWRARPREPLELPGGGYLARGTLEAPGLRGQVGLLPHGAGARVRFVLEGRAISTRVVDELRPLILRAVVACDDFAANEGWDDIERNRAFYAALRAMAEAAASLVADALEAGSGDPDALRAYGRDLVRWFVAQRPKRRDARGASLRRSLAAGLASLPLYPVAGGGYLSLEDLAGRGTGRTLRVAATSRPEAALDGRPVVLIDDPGGDREHLELLLGKSCIDYAAVLRRERRLRERLAGEREALSLAGPMLARVAFEENGLRGEIGAPETADPWGAGDLILLHEGLRVTRRLVAPRYGAFAAKVESSRIRPNEAWDDVLEDEGFRAVVDTLAALQDRLVAALVEAVDGSSLGNMHEVARVHFVQFIREKLAPLPEELGKLERAVASAPLFESSPTSMSLLDLAVARRSDRAIWIARGEDCEGLRRSPQLPEDVIILGGGDLAAELLPVVFGRTFPIAEDELQRRQTLASFEERPIQEAELPDRVAPWIDFSGPGFSGRLGYAAGNPAGARVELHFRQRKLRQRRWPAPFPLVGVAEVEESGVRIAERDVTVSQAQSIERAIVGALPRLLETATASLPHEQARSLLLEALAQHRRLGLPKGSLKQLLGTPLFERADGGLASWRDLVRKSRVFYVTDSVPAELLPKQPVARIREPAELRALGASGAAQDMTEPIRRRATRLAQHLDVDPVGEIAVEGDVLFRHRFEEQGVMGEVALHREPGARVTLYQLRRPAGEVALPGLSQVRGAVNCDALRLRADLSGVVPGPELSRALRIVRTAIDQLFGELSKRWPTLASAERARLLPVLARALGALQIHRPRWRGRALELPVLEAAGSEAVSWRELRAAARGRGGAPTLESDSLPGWKQLDALPEAARLVPALWRQGWAWLPREGERELAQEAGIRLDELSAEATRAITWLEKPRLESLRMPEGLSWREPIEHGDFEGEVALPSPSWQVGRIHLYTHRRLLYEVEDFAPSGYAAVVNCDALYTAQGDEQRSGALLRRIRRDVERACERLIRRELAAGHPPGEPWWRYLRSALRGWKQPGPLKRALEKARLVKRVGGGAASIAELLLEVEVHGRVACVAPGTGSVSRRGLVIVAGDRELVICEELGIDLEDLTPQDEGALLAAGSGEVRPTYDGRALVRLPVDEEGWRGELVLPLPHARGLVIRLASPETRGAEHRTRPGASGILYSTVLAEPGSGIAPLDAGNEHRIAGWVDQLYARVARESLHFDAEQRKAAALYLLHYLRDTGLWNRKDLLEATGIAAQLAGLPLFESASGEWLSLATIVSRVERDGFVHALDRKLSPRELGGEIALRGRLWKGRQGQAFRSLLGRDAIRFVDKAGWERHRAEGDPPADTPLAIGFERLRAAVERARGGVPSRLERLRRELRGVRLHRSLGDALFEYDEKRQVVFVNLERPGVRKALEESEERPDRIQALVVGILGEVNRGSWRFDEAEERAVAEALLLRLAANPEQLGDGPGSKA